MDRRGGMEEAEKSGEGKEESRWLTPSFLTQELSPFLTMGKMMTWHGKLGRFCVANGNAKKGVENRSNLELSEHVRTGNVSLGGIVQDSVSSPQCGSYHLG